MKQPLTDRELAILAFARDFHRHNDMLPPTREISVAMGNISFSTVLLYQYRLEAKGYLERNSVGKWRFAREGIAA